MRAQGRRATAPPPTQRSMLNPRLRVVNRDDRGAGQRYARTAKRKEKQGQRKGSKGVSAHRSERTEAGVKVAQRCPRAAIFIF